MSFINFKKKIEYEVWLNFNNVFGGGEWRSIFFNIIVVCKEICGIFKVCLN